MEIRWKRDEILQAREMILKKVLGGEKLEMSWWRQCSDVSQLCSNNDDSGEGVVAKKDIASTQTETSAIRHKLDVDSVTY